MTVVAILDNYLSSETGSDLDPQVTSPAIHPGWNDSSRFLYGSINASSQAPPSLLLESYCEPGSCPSVGTQSPNNSSKVGETPDCTQSALDSHHSAASVPTSADAVSHQSDLLKECSLSFTWLSKGFSPSIDSSQPRVSGRDDINEQKANYTTPTFDDYEANEILHELISEWEMSQLVQRATGSSSSLCEYTPDTLTDSTQRSCSISKETFSMSPFSEEFLTEFEQSFDPSPQAASLATTITPYGSPELFPSNSVSGRTHKQLTFSSTTRNTHVSPELFDDPISTTHLSSRPHSTSVAVQKLKVTTPALQRSHFPTPRRNLLHLRDVTNKTYSVHSLTTESASYLTRTPKQTPSNPMIAFSPDLFSP